MTEADCPRIFSATLHEMMEEEFAAHGIDAITEDEEVSIVSECVRRVYPQGVMELRIMQGMPPGTPPGVSGIERLLAGGAVDGDGAVRALRARERARG